MYSNLLEADVKNKLFYMLLLIIILYHNNKKIINIKIDTRESGVVAVKNIIFLNLEDFATLD